LDNENSSEEDELRTKTEEEMNYLAEFEVNDNIFIN
jgi:hypothetical protein